MQGGSVQVPASVSLNLAGSSRRSYRRRSNGRSRSSSRYGRSRSSSRRRSYYSVRAAARKAYVRGKWPSSEYAHIRVKRGSEAAASLGIGPPGSTFQESTPEQQAHRRSMQWYGRGKYMQGRGGYIGKMAGGLLGGLAGTAAAAGAVFQSGGLLAGTAPAVIQGATLIGGAAGSQFEDYLRDRKLQSNEALTPDVRYRFLFRPWRVLRE